MIGNRGQLFTFDSLLAVLLISLVLVTSGRVAGIARERGTDYVNRYSLERRASDAADILVRSPGKPENWHRIGEVDTPGLAKTTENGSPLPSYMDMGKLYTLRTLASGKKPLDPLENLLGTERYKVDLIREDGTNTTLYKNWDSINPPDLSDSLEVVSVKRLVFGSTIDVKGETPPLMGKNCGVPPSLDQILNFYVSETELEDFDWYVYVENQEDRKYPKDVDIFINKEMTGMSGWDYELAVPSYEQIDKGLLEEGNNFIEIGYQGKREGQDQKFVVYILALPPDIELENIPEMIKEKVMTLRLSLWR
ncbi:MAG: hypothetical protein ACLFUR_01700 [Candidatus Hadarchaeia archaeon]